MTQDIPTGAAAEPIDRVQELMRLADEYGYKHHLAAEFGTNDAEDEAAAARTALETAIRAALAHPAATAVCVPAEPVARVVSWVNGSYSRKYTLEWLGDADEGDLLYRASPAASTAGATSETPEALGDAASRPGLSVPAGASTAIPIAAGDGLSAEKP